MQPSNKHNSFAKQYQADLEFGVERSCEDYCILFPGEMEEILERWRSIDGKEPNLPFDESSPGETELPTIGVQPPEFSFSGDQMGDYRIHKQLGQGGQGMVFLATDERLGRLVALKVLSGMAMKSEKNLARFRREAEAASKLHDTGICTVYETGTIEGIPFIAMEYIEGLSLGQKLKSERQSSKAPGDNTDHKVPGATSTTQDLASNNSKARSRVDVYVSIIRDVARALHTAHKVNMVHRDIKPGNIMVADSGRVVILDFGIAHDDDAQAMGLTRTGDLIGTPAYMAPEQIRGDVRRLDRRTDVYALGVTLYECVTLLRPFSAPTREALYRKILLGHPPAASSLGFGVSRDLDVIIATCMELDPNRRYGTAAELADDLDRLLNRLPIKARPTNWSIRLGHWAQRNPVVAALSIIVFVVLISALAVTTDLWRKSETERVRADEKTREAKRALSNYEMLSDSLRFQHFEREIPSFFPPHPDRIPQLDDWLSRVQEFIDREPLYLAQRKALEEQSELVTLAEIRRKVYVDDVQQLNDLYQRRATIVEQLREPDLADERRQFEKLKSDLDRLIEETEKATLKQFQYQFDDTEAEWQHTNITRIIRSIRVLKIIDEPFAPQALVRRLREQCAVVEQRSIVDHKKEWEQAIQSIRESSMYGGLVMEPQMGLVPLGENPATRLWEFADILTGTIPERKRDGQLDVVSESAVIFILLPGGVVSVGARAPAFFGEEAPFVDPGWTGRELPLSEVSLDPFLFAKHEFSIAQWSVAFGEELRITPEGKEVTQEQFRRAGRSPLTRMSCEMVIQFIRRIGCVLPTDVQWEYACRGGTTTPWPSGQKWESLVGRVNLGDDEMRRSGRENWDDGFSGVAPVDAFSPNQFGFYNMIGNVWEFTRDGIPVVDGIFFPGDGLHTLIAPDDYVLRGGSVKNEAERSRVALRASVSKETSAWSIGFRVTRKLLGKWSRQ